MSEYSKQKDKKYKRTPRLQEKLDAWLNEEVNIPLAEKGFGGLGAGISAAGSTIGSLFDSDENVMAMSAPGVGKLGSKAAKEAARQQRIYLRRLNKEIADAENAAKKTIAQSKAKTLSYSDLDIPAKEAKQKAVDTANTLKKYERFGKEK